MQATINIKCNNKKQLVAALNKVIMTVASASEDEVTAGLLSDYGASDHCGERSIKIVDD